MGNGQNENKYENLPLYAEKKTKEDNGFWTWQVENKRDSFFQLTVLYKFGDFKSHIIIYSNFILI